MVMVGTGVPDVVTLKEKAVPTVAVAVAGLVNLGGVVELTVSVNACVVEPAELAAVNVSDVVPATVGVPERVAVPFALALNVTPEGSAPATVNVGVGLPDAATVKFNADPTRTEVECGAGERRQRVHPQRQGDSVTAGAVDGRDTDRIVARGRRGPGDAGATGTAGEGQARRQGAAHRDVRRRLTRRGDGQRTWSSDREVLGTEREDGGSRHDAGGRRRSGYPAGNLAAVCLQRGAGHRRAGGCGERHRRSAGVPDRDRSGRDRSSGARCVTHSARGPCALLGKGLGHLGQCQVLRVARSH